MNKLCCVLLIMLCPFFASAEKALSTNIVQAFASSLKEFQQLAEKYPELEETLEQTMLSADKSKVLNNIKSLPLYPKIAAVISSAGFESFDEYYDISTRIMGAVYSSQVDKMPAGMSADSLANIVKMQVDNLKKQGAPKEVIAEMELDVSRQIHSMQTMLNLAKSASAADKKFVNNNMTWLMEILSMADDDLSEEPLN